MMSVTTKLHILLITTILGVGLYMFLLFKEIKMFERELADLRIKVQSIATHIPQNLGFDVVDNNTVVKTLERPQHTTIAEAIAAACPNIVADNMDDISENMSVTSNEIKEILTNIQDLQEVDIDVTAKVDSVKSGSGSGSEAEVEQGQRDETAVPRQKVVSGTFDVDSWAHLSDAEIQSLKYDELRAILRKRGMSGKGAKSDLISLVISLKNDAVRE